MSKDDFLVLVGLLTTAALVGSCASGEIGGLAEEARGGPESGAFGDGLEPSPDVAAEFSEDGVPGVVEPTEPGKTDASSQTACPSATAEVSANDGWRSIQASQAAFDTLRFEFMARPAVANLNGLVAVGAQHIDEFTDAAISVRFAGSGFVDARDGSSYDADTFIAYEPGVWYSFVISADIVARTYDVDVGRCGEPHQALITGAAFRSDASVSDRLTTWAVWSSQSAGLELSTPAWVASGSCAPSTCQSLGSECGGPSDGCGSSLNCGSCGGDEACASGICVDVPVTVPPPAPPGGDPERPGAHNTGYTGPLTPYTGPSTITQDGATYENVDITGKLVIDADNVTIRNFYAHGAPSADHAIQIAGGHSGILLEDGEIIDADNGVVGVGYTARRLHIHDVYGDGFKPQGSGGATVIEYSFIERLGLGAGAHADCWQSATSTSNVTIRYNNCYIPTRFADANGYHSNAAIIFQSGQSYSNFTVDSNWLEGGNFTIYCGAWGGLVVTNNRFGRDYKHGIRYHSEACDEWTGNVWDDTDDPI